MSLPGVTVNVLDGQLNLQAPSAEKTMIYLGVCTLGTPDILTFFGDTTALQTACDTGELVEAAAYGLAISGGPVGVMPLTPTVAGGFSAVTHVGRGSATVSVAGVPHLAIVLTITTAGTLGAGAFTYKVGTEPTSSPVTIPAGRNYLVPGTYCTLTFAANSVTVGDTYTISTLGAVTHAGTGSTVTITQSSSPIDGYTPKVVCTTAGSLGVAQFTYSLDGTDSNTSAAIATTSAGTYQIPNSGILLTFSAALTLADYWTFKTAGPTYGDADLVAAMTALETTYLSSSYALAVTIGNLASATAWSTQV